MPSFYYALEGSVPPPGPPGAPPPNLATIPLPPGMTLPQFLRFQGELVNLIICTAVGFALVCWDYFVLFGEEMRLYRTSNKQMWKTPGMLAFVVLRYAAFLAVLPSLFFTAIQNQYCQVAVITSQVGALLVVASAGVIFCHRVVAIWSNNKLVIAFLTLAWAGMMGCWLALAVTYRAITGPPTPFGSNCQMQPVVSWAPISFASSVAFDVIILMLTTIKLRRGAGGIGQTEIARQMSSDNLAYFLITAVVNIAVFTIQALGSPKFNLIKPAVMPFSTVVTVAMAQRVYLNLKLFHHRRDGQTVHVASHVSSIAPRRMPTKAEEVGGYSQSGGYGQSFTPGWEMAPPRGRIYGQTAVPVVYVKREASHTHVG